VPHCPLVCYKEKMSWKIKEKYRKIISEEEGYEPRRGGGGASVCLVYPNRYRVGMSNLGFQAVYALVNSLPGWICERAFLPDPDDRKEYEKSGTPLLSLESQRELREFDVVAFSVSFESDYLVIPEILDLAKIPPLAADRDESYPLVIAGGAAIFLNPEPAADFFDLACIGEAEPLLQPLLELLHGEFATRADLLRQAARLRGIYVPSLYEPRYDGGRYAGYTALDGAPRQVERVWAETLAGEPTSSTILTPGTEFSDMFLVEVSRGCPRGCRFCAAGFIYLPFRQRPVEELEAEAVRGLEFRKKIGLVGAAVSDYRDIGKLCTTILEHGGKVSVSSLRIDGLDGEMIEVLKKSGHMTVALAPEGGSQRLRDLVAKNINEEQILAACDLLISRDILNLKLYFIIGLPTETEEDLAELVALTEKIRLKVLERAKANRRIGDIQLSVNPFVPKPFTPLQWCGMEPIPSLEKKIAFLRDSLRKMPNVKLQVEGPRDAFLQALLSRGDRRLSAFLLEGARGGNWRKAMKGMEWPAEEMVNRTIPLDEPLPWDVIADPRRERLVREYRAALRGEITAGGSGDGGLPDHDVIDEKP
jgi:radical SAM superfamily enzyme YgiQ (UPF0313 family)